MLMSCAASRRGYAVASSGTLETAPPCVKIGTDVCGEVIAAQWVTITSMMSSSSGGSLCDFQ
jgi:hypothetical protein